MGWSNFVCIENQKMRNIDINTKKLRECAPEYFYKLVLRALFHFNMSLMLVHGNRVHMLTVSEYSLRWTYIFIRLFHNFLTSLRRSPFSCFIFYTISFRFNSCPYLNQMFSHMWMTFENFGIICFSPSSIFSLLIENGIVKTVVTCYVQMNQFSCCQDSSAFK